MEEHDREPSRAESVARKAAETQTSLLGDYWRFLRRERKYWLLPILVVLLLAGGFVVLAGTAGAPLLYALF